MPMFTNNAKVAAVSIDKGLVALGVAISFEAAYNLMNEEYDLQGSREEYVAWVADELFEGHWTPLQDAACFLMPSAVVSSFC